MKWGIRRYQNYDGTLTPLGRKHYYGDSKAERDPEYGWLGNAKQAAHFSKVTDKEFAKEYRKSTKGKYKTNKGMYYFETNPNELVAAEKTRAKHDIENTGRVKSEKQKLIKTIKPDLDFELDGKTQKKFGYDVNNYEETYDKAKENYMKSIGLGTGTKERKKYEDEKVRAFENYNSVVRNTIEDILGARGSEPVTVVSKLDKVYYSTAKDGLRKLLTYGWIDNVKLSGEGVQDFYRLVVELESQKS